MGSWKLDIYSNDVAQDTLIFLEEGYDKYKNIYEAIQYVAQNCDYYNTRNECILVLADFELDLSKNLVSNNLYMVEKTLKDELKFVTHYDDESEVRKAHLLEFKNKLETYKNNTSLSEEPSYDSVKKWLIEKRGLDIWCIDWSTL